MIARRLSLPSARRFPLCSLTLFGLALVLTHGWLLVSVAEEAPLASTSAKLVLDNTYWYVPTSYLPALLAINTAEPRITRLADQTVWHIEKYSKGYITGISATNVGFGWSYMLIVGSVTPEGSVKLSFSPIGAVNPNDPTTQTITIGDGSLSYQGRAPAFLMQMTSGTAGASVTHWAYMLPVTPNDPEWRSLPGYPATGVPALTGLQIKIVYVGSQPTN